MSTPVFIKFREWLEDAGLTGGYKVQMVEWVEQKEDTGNMKYIVFQPNGGTPRVKDLSADDNVQVVLVSAKNDAQTVSAGSMYRVGEGGEPELLQSGGKNYMIPGDGGKVISNADLQTGGGGNIQVSVVFNDYTSGSHSYDAQTSQDGNNLTIQAFVMDMDNKGPMHTAITRNTTATSRATGG